MAEPSGAATPKPSGDRLDSWKEIATYVGRDVSTVQRWEKRERMPVHRHIHDRLGSVYAYRHELDEWLRTRNAPGALPIAATDVAAANGTQSGSRTVGRRFISAALAMGLVVAGTLAWLARTDTFWRSPIDGARFVKVTDFDDVQGAAALSRDGRFAAFLSNRDGSTDVWVTQVGSGQFHNLTHGRFPELVNAAVRTLGFVPDGTSVTFWARKDNGFQRGAVSQWTVPTLGGEPRPLLDGAAEVDWSPDGSRLVFHTAADGDPMFVADASRPTEGRRIFAAPNGEHSHFPLWSSDARDIYFVEGSFLAKKLDIWRIPSRGGAAERITFHQSAVTYPILLNPRTLMYLATDADGSGPWLYAMDVEHRIPHRVSAGPEQYTSLSADADGHRLLVTLASPKHTLWRVPLADSASDGSVPTRVALPTMAGSAPRQAGESLLYVADGGEGESIWKTIGGTATELWTAAGARLLGGPAVSRDGSRIAFSVQLHGRSLLYAMQADGTGARIVAASLAVQGAPTWASDGQSVIVSALDPSEPHLFRVPLDGGAPRRVTREYAVDPASAPDDAFVLFSGPEVGPTFPVHAVTSDGVARPLPSLTLTRGARRLVFMPGGHTVLVLRGEMQHQNVWRVDLDTGEARQLTHFPADFDVRDFDVAAGGRDLIVERIQNQSDVVLLELPRR